LLKNYLLTHIIEGKKAGEKRREDKEEDVSSCWMTFREGKVTGN
jgi:hypothetical protein